MNHCKKKQKQKQTNKQKKTVAEGRDGEEYTPVGREIIYMRVIFL